LIQTEVSQELLVPIIFATYTLNPKQMNFLTLPFCLTLSGHQSLKLSSEFFQIVQNGVSEILMDMGLFE